MRTVDYVKSKQVTTVLEFFALLASVIIQRQGVHSLDESFRIKARKHN